MATVSIPVDDELFKYTTIQGMLALEQKTVRTETAHFDQRLIFERDPEQLLNALVPLHGHPVSVARKCACSSHCFARHCAQPQLPGIIKHMLEIRR
jgi:hypothetical protein